MAHPPPRLARTNRWITLLIGASVFLSLLMVSRFALLELCFSGVSAALTIVPWMLAGFALVPRATHAKLPPRWTVLVCTAVGLGCGSLLVLILGTAGWLDRSLWIGIQSAAGIVGLVRARTILAPAIPVRLHSAEDSAGEIMTPPGSIRHVWLLLAPFLVLGVLAASNAPGFVWEEEGYGYDVQEYHLQLPKEFRSEGAVTYTPHNVYGNFPLNMEMYYLLLMILVDDDRDAGIPANFIHWFFAILFVFAVWVVASDWSHTAGAVAAVTAGSVNWLWYLGGLAYTELGLIFYGVVAVGLVLRNGHSVPLMTLAGVCVGFASGCKYTAVPMIVIPLMLVVAADRRLATTTRLRVSAAMGMGVLLAFSPWLIRNTVNTGNPVFPLAGTWFSPDTEGWDVDSAKRWDRGHRPAPEENNLKARFAALWRHVPADHLQRYGPAACGLGLLGLIRRRRERVDLVLLIMLAAQIAVWMFATHLYARFAVVMLIPLVLLAGRAVGTNEGRGRIKVGHIAVVLALVLGVGWNMAFAIRTCQIETPYGAPASLLYDGRYKAFEHFGVVNHELPPESKLLLVGEARAFYYDIGLDYSVVFNRNPFVEAIRGAGDAKDIVSWLREQGYTHVLVHWQEIDRLRRSRYEFPAEINETLFEQLTAAEGPWRLNVRNEFALDTLRGRYITLYEVVSPDAS